MTHFDLGKNILVHTLHCNIDYDKQYTYIHQDIQLSSYTFEIYNKGYISYHIIKINNLDEYI